MLLVFSGCRQTPGQTNPEYSLNYIRHFITKQKTMYLNSFSHDMLYLTAFSMFRSRVNANCILAMVMIIVFESCSRELLVWMVCNEIKKK